MDIDEADRLYRSFHKTNEGAKQKQGLGFGGGGRSDEGPWKKHADAAPSLFVRQGEGLPAPSRVNAEQSTKREREERASRVAQRMAELKEQNANKGNGGKQQSRGQDSWDPGTSGRHEQEDRPGARASTKAVQSEGKADLHYDSRGDPYRDGSSRRREEGGRRERDGLSERREGGRSGSGSSRREREQSSRIDEEERGSSRRREDRHGHTIGSSTKRGERCAEHSGRRHGESSRGADDRHYRGSGRRDSSREGRKGGREEGSRGSKLKEQSHAASGQKQGKQDLGRLIPGYNEMTLQEKLQARTRFALSEAERASRKRSRQEEVEDEEVARAQGRESGGGPVRQWTRYNFNPQAPLAQESQAKAGDLGARDTATTAIELGVDKDGETLNPMGFSRTRETEEMKKRDEDHTAAIWGAHSNPFSKAQSHQQQQQQQRQVELSSPVAADRCTDHADEGGQEQGQSRAGAQSVNEAEALAELARREGWTAEDAPVVVMEEEHAAPSASPGGAGASQEAEAVAETIRSQQKGLSWRERANAAKARKSAAAPPAPPVASAPALQLSWRDKAKARGGRAMAASNVLE